MDLNLIEEWKNNGMTWNEIGIKLAETEDGDAYHLSERARKQLYRRRTVTNLANGAKSSTVVEPYSSIDVEQLNDDNDLLRLHGYDPSKWELVDSSCTIHNDKVNTRVKVKPKPYGDIDLVKLQDAIFKSIENTPTIEVHHDTDTSNVLFVNMFDLHYGRKYREMNHINTTLDALLVIDNIVEHYKGKPLLRIELPIGQDIFNSDNATNSTTKGTPQTNSLEWYEMYSKGVALVVQIIAKLSVLAPVTIRYSMGNHDAVLGYTLVQALALKYEHRTDVNVDTTFEYRQYVELPNVLIGISHGNEEKNLTQLMQSEAREAWGRCEHHIWFSGHFHHLESIDKDGIIWFKCPSLAFVDNYHDIKGFTVAERMCACFLIDTTGIKEIYFAKPESR